jgi:hypothetical protein
MPPYPSCRQILTRCLEKFYLRNKGDPCKGRRGCFNVLESFQVQAYTLTNGERDVVWRRAPLPVLRPQEPKPLFSRSRGRR